MASFKTQWNRPKVTIWTKSFGLTLANWIMSKMWCKLNFDYIAIRRFRNFRRTKHSGLRSIKWPALIWVLGNEFYCDWLNDQVMIFVLNWTENWNCNKSMTNRSRSATRVGLFSTWPTTWIDGSSFPKQIKDSLYAHSTVETVRSSNRQTQSEH